MTQVDVDDSLYADAKKFWENSDKVEYPTFKNFVEKVLRDRIKE